jgi:hypothetical protein
MGQNINWWVLNGLGHRHTWGSYLPTSNSSKSNKVTQSQLTTQGQSFEANLASLEVMIEQVFNDDHAMVKFENSFKEKSKALVDIFRNKWIHNHLLYQVFFSKVLRKTTYQMFIK